jgi:C-terminal processing protease CtpA/Prc
MLSSIRSVFLVAVVGAAASSLVLSVPRPVQAQLALERCDDLGVMVQYVNGGFVVRSMLPGGIAEGMGLMRGDLIFAVDGRPPRSLDDLHAVLFSGEDNALHDLDVLRGDAHLHTSIYHLRGRVYFSGTLH